MAQKGHALLYAATSRTESARLLNYVTRSNPQTWGYILLDIFPGRLEADEDISGGCRENTLYIYNRVKSDFVRKILAKSSLFAGKIFFRQAFLDIEDAKGSEFIGTTPLSTQGVRPL